MIRVRAPAKLNLWLRVLARETDGYHQIETLFCALELADELEITEAAPGIRLDVEGARLGPVEDNLVYRAARSYHDAIGRAPAVHVRLRKHVPAGAGLGGGSSDAAATLLALDRMHGEPVGREGLLDMGARLGADVPFFVTGAPLALGWGRGDRLLPLPPPPGAPVLLAVPPFAVSTPEAYRLLDERRDRDSTTAGASVLDPSACGDWTAIAARAANDFEDALRARHPELEEIRGALDAHGARIARVTGSGSAVFGVFRDEAGRAQARRVLARTFDGVRLIETASRAG